MDVLLALRLAQERALKSKSKWANFIKVGIVTPNNQVLVSAYILIHYIHT
jgi:hypothetical protein